MSDFETIKKELDHRIRANIEQLCSAYYPKGSKSGKDWKVGNVSGESGQSMSIQLTGDKTGLWYDHAESRGGYLIDAIAEKNGTTWIEAFDELCGKLGVSRVSSFSPKPKPKPYRNDGLGAMRGTPVLQYLHNRGLKEQTLLTYNIRSHKAGDVRCFEPKDKDSRTPKQMREAYWKHYAEQHGTDANEWFWVARYTDAYGDRVLLKSFGIDKINGKHDVWTTNPYYTLWGWWLVKPHHKEIIICEGEIDCASVHQMLGESDLPVLSLPCGVSNMGWVDNDFDALNQFEKVYILFDNDKPDKRGVQPGEKGAKEVAERLGRARCFRVRYPEGYKDANNVLIDGKEHEKNVQQWLATAKTYDPPTMRGLNDLVEETISERKKRLDAIDNGKFAWQVPFVQPEGEITIFEGYSGSGKSTACYQMALSDMQHGHGVLFCSLEIPANEMVEEMATQWLGKMPSDVEFRKFAEKFAGKIYYVEDHDDSIRPASLLNDIEYACRRFNVTRVYIDSLHFLVDKDDYQGQDNLVKSIMKLAKKLRKAHITLIAHSRYGDAGEGRMPRVDDIEGSKGMIKPAQNILAWWRNIPKEEAKEDPSTVTEDKYAELMAQPDAYLKCYKQRNGHRKRFTQGMWFHFASRRFRTDQFKQEAALSFGGQPKAEWIAGDEHNDDLPF